MWINRVMQCVKIILYNFVRDGKVFGDVHPQRGLRQGDPISSYLYILCVEDLIGILRKYEDTWLIHGCKVARGAPSISHLLFADDYYFFFRAMQTEANIMKSILQRYERLSRQLINYNKSEITFSPNTCIDVRFSVCQVLGVRQTNKPGKYLGMPMCVGRSTNEVFGFLS
ncbi:uncharacterized protein LOC141685674 [Apium graveolens]|uniref:uncharacterized protein LOC141685674 n=1 Tax=Apium graveolens TaxID=4045 RepID=UPI003D79DCFF